MDQEQSQVVRVDLSSSFDTYLSNLTSKDQDKVYDFINHLESSGVFHGLKGRNKFSDNVDNDDPMWHSKIQFVRKHHLWHYHVGIPMYDNANGAGDWTSEYVLHYQYFKDEKVVRIVKMTSHPPFELPTLNDFRNSVF